MLPACGTNYNFVWKDLGDIATGRPNLGPDMPVLVYRLAQYTMREALAQRYNQETASILLREAGWIAGREFCKNVLDCSLEFGAFVDRLQATLKALKIGIMRIEYSDLAVMTFTLTVSEDLDCSGLPISGVTVCEYDEGFISGILHMYTGKEFAATEIDCWATGDRTCRFVVKQGGKSA
ncbi:MAG: 4-vinyl reductase [Desulfobulbaceae bacterium A2]|nr:MAG: 4-vinyl reductase [Desulfobulbaceae bacterium A2]